MALVSSVNCINYHNKPFSQISPNFQFNRAKLLVRVPDHYRVSSSSSAFTELRWRRRFLVFNKLDEGRAETESGSGDDEVDSAGVKTALSMLRFYKREISPLLPNSCRYLPTCSEYSMIAYKKYGVVKGTILTAWRLCRCNPLGGSGFDPPRWFGEKTAPPEQ